jgi:hypothetical protein
VRTAVSNPTQGLLFEEDYILRTLGPLGHRPDIALTELVANNRMHTIVCPASASREV